MYVHVIEKIKSRQGLAFFDTIVLISRYRCFEKIGYLITEMEVTMEKLIPKNYKDTLFHHIYWHTSTITWHNKKLDEYCVLFSDLSEDYLKQKCLKKHYFLGCPDFMFSFFWKFPFVYQNINFLRNLRL